MEKTVELKLKPDKIFIIVGVVMCLVGIALVVGMSFYSVKLTAKLKSYTVIEGTVIDYKITRDKDSHNDMYAEIAQFEVDGVTYTVTNSVSATTGVKKIGETVRIAYNPDDPNDCVFDTAGNKMVLVLVLLLGAIFAIAGIHLIRSYFTQLIKWKKSQDEDNTSLYKELEE